MNERYDSRDSCPKNNLQPCTKFTTPLTIDASTSGRFISFTVRVCNLCRNKDYLLAVVIYDGDYVVGEIFKKLNSTGSAASSCYDTDVVFENVLICEPICASSNLKFKVYGNYVDSCKSNYCDKKLKIDACR